MNSFSNTFLNCHVSLEEIFWMLMSLEELTFTQNLKFIQGCLHNVLQGIKDCIFSEIVSRAHDDPHKEING